MKTHRESPYMGLMPPPSLSGDHARARPAASTSALTLSCASRWRCQQHQRHVYISARAARERKSAPQEPRHASAPWHASVVLIPATPPALPCAVAAHSSALRPGAAHCPCTFYAPPPGLSHMHRAGRVRRERPKHLLRDAALKVREHALPQMKREEQFGRLLLDHCDIVHDCFVRGLEMQRLDCRGKESRTGRYQQLSREKMVGHLDRTFVCIAPSTNPPQQVHVL